MHLDELLQNKELKPKEKTETICKWILDASLPLDELLHFAENKKDPIKATCIEAIEFATKQHPEIANENVWRFVTEMLTAKAPRIKWESAKVVGNIAYLFTHALDTTVENLLINARHHGTVVRWSAAFALGEILKLKTNFNPKLLPAIEAICEEEIKNSIKKIYQVAIKKSI